LTKTKKLQLLAAESKNIKKRWTNELQFSFFDRLTKKIKSEDKLDDVIVIGSPILSSS
jgi:stalled ribosome rescue protein Dom34